VNHDSAFVAAAAFCRCRSLSPAPPFTRTRSEEDSAQQQSQPHCPPFRQSFHLFPPRPIRFNDGGSDSRPARAIFCYSIVCWQKLDPANKYEYKYIYKTITARPQRCSSSVAPVGVLLTVTISITARVPRSKEKMKCWDTGWYSTQSQDRAARDVPTQKTRERPPTVYIVPRTGLAQTCKRTGLYCPQDRGCGHVPNALRANRAYATRLGQGHHTTIPP
jgi:hypothetical protein